MSRATADRYTERHRTIGLCTKCSNPTYLGGILCRKHRASKRLKMRRLTGSKPWRRGKRGRPPLEARS